MTTHDAHGTPSGPALPDGTDALVALVVARLVGEDSLPVQVRGGGFVDEAQVAELLAALQVLAGRLVGERTVPKALALATVNVASRFENSHYALAQQERLEDIGHEVERLAEELYSG